MNRGGFLKVFEIVKHEKKQNSDIGIAQCGDDGLPLLTALRQEKVVPVLWRLQEARLIFLYIFQSSDVYRVFRLLETAIFGGPKCCDIHRIHDLLMDTL